jgi:hypothetical protein
MTEADGKTASVKWFQSTGKVMSHSIESLSLTVEETNLLIGNRGSFDQLGM